MAWGQRVIPLSSILLTAFVIAGCVGNLVYHPDKELAATPASVDLKYESVAFMARDGIRLSGWWVPAPAGGSAGAGGERGVLLFCHGNAGNISNRLDKLLVFNRLGLSVFIFDYRGFGRSEGKPTEAGTYLDAESARDYLLTQRRIPPERLILYGESLGGAVAARLARLPCRALILDSAFTSLREVAHDHAPWFPGSLLSDYRYRTEDYVRESAVPVLVLHSPDDEVVPYRHGQQLYRSAGNPVGFVQIRGSHNRGFLQSLPAYRTGIDDFLLSIKLVALASPGR